MSAPRDASGDRREPGREGAPEARTPEAIARRVEALYGAQDWRGATGLLHVAAIGARSGCVLAIGPEAPSSPTDRFVLGFARARADAIVTTGAILRAEPGLVHTYAEDPELDAAFAAWRRRTLGREAAPRLVVLSASGRWPAHHPAIAAARAGLVWTGVAGAAHLARGAGPGRLGVEVDEAAEADPAGSLDRLLARLRQAPGIDTILLEAGPGTTGPLYARAAARGVDELLLSRFEGELAALAEGPAFVPDEWIARALGPPRSETRLEEASGVWRFARHRRRERDADGSRPDRGGRSRGGPAAT